MPDPLVSNTGSARRWLTLSLRLAMIAIAAAAVWLGWVTNHARRQAEVIGALRAKGALVYFDDQYPRGAAMTRPPKASAPARGPVWLRRFLGDEYFRRPVFVAWGLGRPPSVRTLGDDEILRRLAALGGPRSLWLEMTEVGDQGLKSVASMRALQELRIAYCPKMTERGLAELTALAQLKSLGLTALPIKQRTVRNISRIAGLETLALDFSQITGEGLRPLGQLTRLHKLELYSSGESTAGLAHLEDLTQLTELHVEFPAIRDETLEPISRLHNLRRLTLRSGTLSDKGFAPLASLENLTELRIAPAEGRLTDNALEPLHKLKHLAHLSLGSGDTYKFKLTEEGLARLVAALPELKTLSLEDVFLKLYPLTNLRSAQPRVRINPVPY